MATVFWIIIFIINEIYLNNLKFNLVKINAVWPIFKFQMYIIIYLWMLAGDVYVNFKFKSLIKVLDKIQYRL